MTNCKGAYVAMVVPEATVRPHVPKEYRFNYASGNAALVALELFNCEKVAVNGLDAGAISGELLLAQVVDPSSAPTPPDFISHYVMEARTNSIAARDWLQALGLTAGNATASTSWSRLLPPQFATFSGFTAADGRTRYEITGLTDYTFHHDQYRGRYYYGPDPSRDFLNQLWEQDWTGAEGGRLTAAEGTLISKLYAGATTAPAAIQLMDGPSRAFTPSVYLLE